MFASVCKAFPNRSRVSRVCRHKSWSRNAKLSSQSVRVCRGCVATSPGRETQNCRRFWPRVVSSRLKSANNHRDEGGPGRETQNCRRFWPRVVSRKQSRHKSWSRNAELSSLLASSAYVLSFCLCQDTTPLRSDDHHCSSSPAQLQHLAQPRPASPAQSGPTQPAQPSTAPPIRCSTLT